jgi:hypothetical protein
MNLVVVVAGCGGSEERGAGRGDLEELVLFVACGVVERDTTSSHHENDETTDLDGPQPPTSQFSITRTKNT